MINDEPNGGMDLLAKAMRRVFREEVEDPPASEADDEAPRRPTSLERTE